MPNELTSFYWVPLPEVSPLFNSIDWGPSFQHKGLWVTLKVILIALVVPFMRMKELTCTLHLK
jgi:hypothetical protein